MSLAIDPTQLLRCVAKFPGVVWVTEPWVDMERCSGIECEADRGWWNAEATVAVIEHLSESGRRLGKRVCGSDLEPEIQALRRSGVHQVSVKLPSFAVEKEKSA